MMKSTINTSKIVPRIYGYILILIGIFLQNVSAIPILFKRDDESAPVEGAPVEGQPIDNKYKQKLISKIIGVIAAIAGFCICFFGHQLYNKIIAFVGFVCGFMLTTALFNTIWNSCSNVIVYIVAFIVGLIFGALAKYAHKVSLCFLGACAGYFVAAILIAFIPDIAKINPFLLTVILAIIFIILVFIYEKPIIIIATGIIGSYLLFYGIDTVIETGLAQAVQTMYDSESFELFESSLSVRAMVIASILVAILGWIVQFISYNKNKDEY